MSEEAGSQHQALARNQESGKGSALERGRGENDEIAPVAQAGDQIEQVLEQIRSSAASLLGSEVGVEPGRVSGRNAEAELQGAAGDFLRHAAGRDP
jgi:hypothetical protein